MIAGRFFDEYDGSKEPVIIVSEELAKRYWNDAADALGRRVVLGVDRFVGNDSGEEVEWLTVVGVSGDRALLDHDG